MYYIVCTNIHVTESASLKNISIWPRLDLLSKTNFSKTAFTTVNAHGFSNLSSVVKKCA